MKWYSKYKPYYGNSWKLVPSQKLESLRRDVQKFSGADKPLVSVVFIAHNEESHLFAAIRSIADNICEYPVELIVINNNSTDSTEEFLRTIGVSYYNELKKGPGYARNCGLNHARGKYYLCLDSDTMYPPYYIRTMVKALQKPGTACVYSLWSFMTDAQHSVMSMWCYESLRDVYLRLQQVKRPELNVRGMVFAFPTELGRKYRFRTDIIRGEDGSLALCMKADGRLRLVTSRKARAVTGHGTIDQDGGLGRMFMVRLKKALGGIAGLFQSKKKYEDKDSNLIKP